jgi:hypothetical protein
MRVMLRIYDELCNTDRIISKYTHALESKKQESKPPVKSSVNAETNWHKIANLTKSHLDWIGDIPCLYEFEIAHKLLKSCYNEIYWCHCCDEDMGYCESAARLFEFTLNHCSMEVTVDLCNKTNLAKAMSFIILNQSRLHNLLESLYPDYDITDNISRTTECLMNVVYLKDRSLKSYYI